MTSSPVWCPECGAGLPAGARACPGCRLPLDGPIAAELWQVDCALAELDGQRSRLLLRRGELLQGLRELRVKPTLVWPGTGLGTGTDPGAASGATLPGRVPVAQPDREVSLPVAQNTLLLLGTMLLMVAAVVFTAVAWGRLGIGGRSVVVGALTAVALGVPALLQRRRLHATAEAVAGLALVLTLLDCYAARRVGLAGLDETGGYDYAAACTALTGAGWFGYGRLLRLRLTTPAALVLGQFPPLLVAFAVGITPFGLGTAFLVTAAFDAVAGLATRRLSLVRVIAVITGSCCGLACASIALYRSFIVDGAAETLRPTSLLLAVAALAAGVAGRLARTRPAEPEEPAGRGAPAEPEAREAREGAALFAAVAGIALIAAAGGTARLVLPARWEVIGYLVAATCVGPPAFALALRGKLRWPVAMGYVAATAPVYAVALLVELPALVTALAVPLGWVQDPWSGAPEGARAALGPATLEKLGTWSGYGVQPTVLALTAVVLGGWAGWLYALRPSAAFPARAVARALACGAVVAEVGTAVVLPLFVDLPYPVAVLLDVAVAAVLVAAAAAVPDAAASRTALGCAAVLAVVAAAWSLAEQWVTLAALGSLLVVCIVAARVLRRPAERVAGAVGAVVALAALAWAAPLAAHLSAHLAAFPVLGAAGLTAAVAAKWRQEKIGQGGSAKPLIGAAAGDGRAVEVAGYGVMALAIGLVADDAQLLSMVLALAGVLLLGVAVHADRRDAGYVAVALFVAATWIRLADAGVHAPEAYTLPVTIPALVIGALRRRRDTAASSWTAYGPGLSVTMLPSLAAALADSGWQRPLALGCAALVTALIGARHRLSAPLLLGAAVLGVDALHEFQPQLVAVLNWLPRWVPLAVGGALLLGVGATYERRLGELRRLRDAYGRLR